MWHCNICLIFFYLKGLATLNQSPKTGVNNPVKTTQYKTSGDSTTGETSLSASITLKEEL